MNQENVTAASLTPAQRDLLKKMMQWDTADFNQLMEAAENKMRLQDLANRNKDNEERIIIDIESSDEDDVIVIRRTNEICPVHDTQKFAFSEPALVNSNPVNYERNDATQSFQQSKTKHSPKMSQKPSSSNRFGSIIEVVDLTSDKKKRKKKKHKKKSHSLNASILLESKNRDNEQKTKSKLKIDQKEIIPKSSTSTEQETTSSMTTSIASSFESSNRNLSKKPFNNDTMFERTPPENPQDMAVKTSVENNEQQQHEVNSPKKSSSTFMEFVDDLLNDSSL